MKRRNGIGAAPAITLAAIIARGETPPKIHDLVALSKRLAKLETSWSWNQKELARMTTGAVDYRYPGLDVDPALAKESYEIAGRMRAALLPLISPSAP